MYKIFTFFVASTALIASAQVTLNFSNYSSWQPQIDSLAICDVPYPAIAVGSNAYWDFTNASYTNANLFISRHAYTLSSNSDVSFGDSIWYKINNNLSYEAFSYAGVTNSGIMYYGEQVPHKLIPIGTITGNQNDSLVFLNQQIDYSSPLVKLKFPATMGSTWQSQYHFTTNFTLTATAYGINNVPCERKTNITKTDTVIGWGKIEVKNRSGVNSSMMDALMVKSSQFIQDSFFMGGSPAPALMLTAFGLSQGQISLKHEYSFYTPGEVTPVLTSVYTDSTFGRIEHIDVLSKNWISTQIGEVNFSNMNIYPNPIVNKSIFVSMENNAAGQIDYSVLTVSGQIISKGSLILQNGKSAIEIDKSITPGIYYLQLSRLGKAVKTYPVEVK